MELLELALAADKTYPGLFHLGQVLYVTVGVIVAVSALVAIVMNIRNDGIHPLEKAELEEIERERAARGAAMTQEATNNG